MLGYCDTRLTYLVLQGIYFFLAKVRSCLQHSISPIMRQKLKYYCFGIATSFFHVSKIKMEALAQIICLGFHPFICPGIYMLLYCLFSCSLNFQTCILQVPEFEEAAFSAPLNKVVRCKTKFGWHLLQVLAER